MLRSVVFYDIINKNREGSVKGKGFPTKSKDFQVCDLEVFFRENE